MSSVIRVRAFAKINLSLRVLGTRDDGYHELRTVFQSIALHDTLVVRRTRGPFALSLGRSLGRDAFGGDGVDSVPTPSPLRPYSVPADRSNLIWRAADALWKSAQRRGSASGAAIHLIKRIPVQAGLGGGSSDAAAALRALARIWHAKDQCVREAAVRIGADVPFFLQGGTVLGLERGDVLFPLIDRPRAWVVLVVPPFGISTPDAYRWWDELGTEWGRSGDGVGTESTPSPIGANDLQAPVCRHHPEISRAIRALTRAGADCAAMSGSGSAVFGLFPSQTAARRAARALGSRFGRTIVTRTLSSAAYRRLAGN